MAEQLIFVSKRKGSLVYSTYHFLVMPASFAYALTCWIWLNLSHSGPDFPAAMEVSNRKLQSNCKCLGFISCRYLGTISMSWSIRLSLCSAGIPSNTLSFGHSTMTSFCSLGRLLILSRSVFSNTSRWTIEVKFSKALNCLKSYIEV